MPYFNVICRSTGPELYCSGLCPGLSLLDNPYKLAIAMYSAVRATAERAIARKSPRL
jgi:hypothetical protein